VLGGSARLIPARTGGEVVGEQFEEGLGAVGKQFGGGWEYRNLTRRLVHSGASSGRTSMMGSRTGGHW
jgi:hypothetical protein